MSLYRTGVSTVTGEEQSHLVKSLAALLHSNSRKVSVLYPFISYGCVA